TAKVTIIVTPTSAAASPIVNTATVSSQSVDPMPLNNSAPVSTPVTPTADLSLSLVAAPSPVQAVQNVTCTLTVVTKGPRDADNVNSQDVLTPNVTFVSATSTAGTAGSVSSQNGTQTVLIPLGTVTNGSTVTATIIVTTTKNTADSIADQASVTSATSDVNMA